MKNQSHYIRHVPNFWQRLHITKARFGRPARGFSWQPPPELYGDPHRGRQILSGIFQATGHLVEFEPRTNIWDIDFPTARFSDDMHGFGWLNDLYATDTAAGRNMAKAWFHSWLQKHRNGVGQCWSPDLVARRMVHWINNGIFLLSGNSKRESRQYFQAIAQHTRLLAKNWQDTPQGKPRFEALCGGLIASLGVTGLKRYQGTFTAALCTSCVSHIEEDGGIKTHNPEEALAIYIYLRWVDQAFENSGSKTPEQIAKALGRMGPALHALCHTTGEMARFHGGGRCDPGYTNDILGTADAHKPDECMGYMRAYSKTASLICDGAAPYGGDQSHNAHASIAAFELTADKSPIVVNSGAGFGFGDDWRNLCRTSAAHSTLVLNRTSSAQYAPGATGPEANFQDRLITANRQIDRYPNRTRLRVDHDAYAKPYGLIHQRSLTLSSNGTKLVGVDRLKLASNAHIDRFEQSRLQNGGGLPLSIRFHLHPSIEAELDLSGGAVSMTLKNGDVWVFRHNSDARLTLEPSMYLEQGRVSPWRNEQIVLFGATADPDVEIRWSFMQAAGVNDIDPKDP